MAKHKNQPGEKAPREGVLALFEQYRGRLQRFLIDRAPGSSVSHDLTQEVYLRLLRFPPRELLRQPQAYLYRIASNVAHDFNLRTREECVTFDSSAVEALSNHATSVGADDPAEQLAATQELEQVLRQLPPAHRAALILAKRDGLSYEEIAKRLGVSTHAVKKYVARALAHCRAAMRDTGIPGGAPFEP